MKRYWQWILLGMGVLLATLLFFPYAQKFLFLRYVIPQVDKRPINDPAHCLPKQGGQKRVVFLGDSITMGTVSANYVNLLAEQIDGDKFDLINGGINGQLAYNVGQRLDEVVTCDPDFVLILVGTNDANAVVFAANTQGYIEGQSLPQTPSAAWYRQNMTAIVTQLKAGTDAQIGLLSLPTMGELPTSDAYQLSTEYSQIVQEVAADTAVTYLPLHETMDTYLRQQTGELRGYDPDWEELMIDGLQRHFLYRQSLDSIGTRNGFLLHVDPLHLNTAGAMMIVDLIRPFIEAEQR